MGALWESSGSGPRAWLDGWTSATTLTLSLARRPFQGSKSGGWPLWTGKRCARRHSDAPKQPVENRLSPSGSAMYLPTGLATFWSSGSSLRLSGLSWPSRRSPSGGFRQRSCQCRWSSTRSCHPSQKPKELERRTAVRPTRLADAAPEGCGAERRSCHLLPQSRRKYRIPSNKLPRWRRRRWRLPWWMRGGLPAGRCSATSTLGSCLSWMGQPPLGTARCSLKWDYRQSLRALGRTGLSGCTMCWWRLRRRRI
mmetsp:Transcript_9462/g.26999  ORF Transcript_9462/g.26999 Transcript_9462/m.26999 type:complete len:253 (-) Transcript_9462:3143-3901(-)